MKSEVFKLQDFRVLFMARVLAVVALQMQGVMVGWHVYELTHDPLWLGLMGLAEALPGITFAFFSGHYVDSRRSAQVYHLSVAILVVNSAWLCFSVWPGAPLSDKARLASIFITVFISGAARSFTSPSLFTLFSHVVPKRLQPEASAWNSSSFQAAGIIGTALGGILYGVFGATGAFAIPPVIMMGCFANVYWLSNDTRQMRSQKVREPFVQSLKAGVNFVLKQKVLLSSMLLDMFSVLFGGAVAILPMYSDLVLHAGSFGVGFLRAAPSVGSGLVALVLGFRPLKRISGRMLLWMVAGFGASTIAFAYTRSFAAAFICLVATGIFDGVSMVIRNTILQLLTPNEMRGRISALSLIFIMSSNEIGAFESGLAARAMNLIPSIIFGGVMTMTIVTGTAIGFPELRRAEIDPESFGKVK